MKRKERKMNKEHGSPYDLGSADAYYQRPLKIPPGLTQNEEAEYLMGYWDQQKSGDVKEYD